jgi:hypothetical protein
MVGCAVDAQWMRSGCAADAQQMRSGRTALRLLWLKQKKTGVPMTPPQHRPKILLTPHHLHLREFCVKLGRNRGNRPNFAPAAFLVGTYNLGDPPPNVSIRPDEGNPSPPPAPVARLPKLPSNAKIVRPRNADVSGQRRVRSFPAAGATTIDTSMQPAAPTNDGDKYTTRAADDSALRRMVIPPCCRLILAYNSYYKYLN